jgi:CPA1 family monovalent cation:H+ antiporter
VTVSSIFNLVALVITFAAVFGWFNHRWLKLPHSIGLVLIALCVSVLTLAVDGLFPALLLEETVRRTLTEIEFHETLMQGMLSFLLFAGALHVDLNTLLDRRWAIGSLATVGIVMSTAIVGGVSFFALQWAGMEVPFIYCLLFGALISPTDPIAVLSILKHAEVPETLGAKIAGESLFNDGVGIVLFTILVASVTGEATLTLTGVLTLFVEEAVGGVVLGFGAGYLAYRAMKAIDEHNLEVLITLSLVMGTYSVASAIHVSGPIAMVVAGLLIGNHGTRFAMSEVTRDHVEKFWSLLDEVLNSVLFLAIGFEVVAIQFTGGTFGIVAAAIPIVLMARFISVGIPIRLLGIWRGFTTGAIRVLTWGGLRGGISVALALSLPDLPFRDTILAATYGVVIFSILVQGLTIERVVRSAVGPTS